MEDNEPLAWQFEQLRKELDAEQSHPRPEKSKPQFPPTEQRSHERAARSGLESGISQLYSIQRKTSSTSVDDAHHSVQIKKEDTATRHLPASDAKIHGQATGGDHSASHVMASTSRYSVSPGRSQPTLVVPATSTISEPLSDAALRHNRTLIGHTLSPTKQTQSSQYANLAPQHHSTKSDGSAVSNMTRAHMDQASSSKSPQEQTRAESSPMPDHVLQKPEQTVSRKPIAPRSSKADVEKTKIDPKAEQEQLSHLRDELLRLENLEKEAEVKLNKAVADKLGEHKSDTPANFAHQIKEKRRKIFVIEAARQEEESEIHLLTQRQECADKPQDLFKIEMENIEHQIERHGESIKFIPENMGDFVRYHNHSPVHRTGGSPYYAADGHFAKVAKIVMELSNIVINGYSAEMGGHHAFIPPRVEFPDKLDRALLYFCAFVDESIDAAEQFEVSGVWNHNNQVQVEPERCQTLTSFLKYIAYWRFGANLDLDACDSVVEHIVAKFSKEQKSWTTWAAAPYLGLFAREIKADVPIHCNGHRFVTDKSARTKISYQLTMTLINKYIGLALANAKGGKTSNSNIQSNMRSELSSCSDTVYYCENIIKNQRSLAIHPQDERDLLTFRLHVVKLFQMVDTSFLKSVSLVDHVEETLHMPLANIFVDQRGWNEVTWVLQMKSLDLKPPRNDHDYIQLTTNGNGFEFQDTTGSSTEFSKMDVKKLISTTSETPSSQAQTSETPKKSKTRQIWHKAKNALTIKP